MTPAEDVLRRSLAASGLPSAGWSALPAAIRDRAFFSSRVESVRFLDAARARVAELLAGARNADGAITSRAQAVSDVMRAARDAGIATGKGGLQDPGSAARAALVVETNAAMAAGRAAAEISNSYGARLAFPAQELVRVEARARPRNWRAIWTARGGVLRDGRMVALKGDPVWTAISRFGHPYPPFDFNSGMGLDDVSFDDAVALGLIEPSYRPPVESPLKAFNDGLEADLKVGDGRLLGELRKMFGDQIRNDNGVIRWRQDLIRDAFTSGKPFSIKLGEASGDLLSRIPASVPAQSLAGKPLTITQDWLDRKRKDGTDHRAHFAPIEAHPGDIPLTLSDLELLPEIWRRPDKAEKVGKHRIMLSMGASDGGTYRAVVDYEGRPQLKTFYKEGEKKGP
ncbi:MAG: hypothetical protein ACI4RA_05585 [Kiritimatiellia bacterium]